MIYNAFRKLLAKYCQAPPQEDSSLIYDISSLQYEKSHPEIRKYYDHVIWHEDNDHKDHFHKRFIPLDDHSHFSSKKSSLKDGSFAKFISISFNEALVNSFSKREFEYAFLFFIENPDEPGISFSSGCYAQNGGSKDIMDKLAEDERYRQGPFQYFTTHGFAD